MDNIYQEEKKGLSFKGSISNILNNKNTKNLQKIQRLKFPYAYNCCNRCINNRNFHLPDKKSKKIKEERKNPLCYNAGISTGLSIISSYFVDKLANKPTESFICKFKEINKTDPKLDKYLEGIKIAKPILIIGGIYYIIIPFISTFLADRASK